MLRKPIFVYLIILSLAGAGLWAIMSMSSSFQAAPHLAGRWELRGEKTSSASQRLSIEQSGRFLRVAIGDGEIHDYRLTTHSATEGTIQPADKNDKESLSFILLAGGDARFVWTQSDQTAATVYSGKRVSAEATGNGAGAQGPASKSVSQHLILILIAEIAVILAASQVIGRLFERIQQPKVMGEMVAGILLGPSLFGWLMPTASRALFPPETIQYLGVLSQVGVIFFLFLIGLELDPKLLRNRGHTAVVVSHASIVAPFLLGAALVMFLYPLLFNDTREMRFNSVTLFMGAAMSITAFPVLARILTERNLHKTQVGAVTLTCAAVDDVSAWCMLAFVVGFARAEGLGAAVRTAIFSGIYVAVMFFLVKPFLNRLQVVYERHDRLDRGLIALIFLLVLVSAATTEIIGIHALFGAFLMGALMPNGTRFVRDLSGKIEEFTIVLLLPIFFAYTGLKMSVGLLNTPELWLLTGLIIFVACLGKFGGSTIAAKLCGLGWRESAAIGILMNTRGLMELVILNIGRDLGVITDAVFTMMVLMALVTTFLTTPILNWVYPDRLLRAASTKLGKLADAFGVLIPVSLPRSGPPLIRLADVITGPDDTRRNIIGLYLKRAQERDAYRAAVNDLSAESDSPLETLLTEATAQNVPIEPMTFVTRDPAADIARLAHQNKTRLILMGFHKPVIGETFLGGTVHRVLEQAETDVAIFIDRGLHRRPQTILVPYLGSPHDRLALELAARIGRHTGAAVTVLHVIPPERDERQKLNAKGETDRVFADPTQPAPVNFKVVEHADPVSAVLEQAKHFDLVAIGIAEEWGLTSQLFGWRAERIARDCPSSLLILHKYTPPTPWAGVTTQLDEPRMQISPG